MYDIITIGAGPAGLAAAVYATRFKLKTLVIAPDLGGQARYRLRLPWITTPEPIIGEDAAQQLRHQLLSATCATRYMDTVDQVFWNKETFHVMTASGGAFTACAVVVASGVRPRTLGVPGEKRLHGYGLSYSALSHGMLFAQHRIVVAGDSPRALQAAAELSNLASHVTLIVPNQPELIAELSRWRLANDPHVRVLAGAEVAAVEGDAVLESIQVRMPNGTVEALQTDGLFVERGLEANTEFVSTLTDRTPSGQIVVDGYCATRTPGLFAAGDVTTTAYAEQMLIALGEGVKAGIGASGYVLASMGGESGSPAWKDRVA